MSPLDDALGAAIEGEYAAIYAYGILGPHLKTTALALAKQAELAHRNQRDALLETMTDAPGPQVLYALPFPVTSAPSAIALAVLVEERCAVLWRAVITAVDASGRQTPLTALTDAAVRAAAFRRAGGAVPGTTTFPGLSA